MDESDSGLVRLFVGLPVPEELKRQAMLLPRNGLNGHWQHPDDLHITLRFLGGVPAPHVDDVIETLSVVRRQPFTLSAKGLARFDRGHKNAWVLYTPILQTRKLMDLLTLVTDRLTPMGFDFGARPYVPHITLCRVKVPLGLSDYIEDHGREIGGEWMCDKFSLFCSGLGYEADRRYSILATIPFGERVV